MATRLASYTGIATVQDQPVMRVFFKLIRDKFKQFFLDLVDVVARRYTGSIGHPEDVGIDGNGGLTERGIENNIGRLSAYPWQGL